MIHSFVFRIFEPQPGATTLESAPEKIPLENIFAHGVRYDFSNNRSVIINLDSQITQSYIETKPFPTFKTKNNPMKNLERTANSAHAVSKDVWYFSRPFTRGFFEEGARSMALNCRSQEGVWVMASTPLSPDTKQTMTTLAPQCELLSAAWGKDPEGTKYGFEDEASKHANPPNY
ncbi:hypothetical protein DL96DRAFT_1569314 [Flagelloscypha sp. PMI_526]|nr:hypothetical protein DL96DRAFT_1569314 [Flagelloscypha sp. PMI_526]